MQVECVVDCFSILEHLKGDELKLPSEQTLIMILSSLKENLRCGTMKRLWWCATTDMAADGLNKGSVARTQLLTVAREGAWYPKLPLKMFQEAVKVPVVTSPEFARSRATAGSKQSFSIFSLLDYEYLTALPKNMPAVIATNIPIQVAEAHEVPNSSLP
jgi:hypothetical protein